MASSSRGSEGADEVANEILEDLVLPWTTDATTVNTFGTLVENDRQLLKELIQCVHKEKDVNATKQKLSVLLGTDKDRKSVVIRARVLSRLIAIALGLHPDDITIDPETGKESLRLPVDFQTTLHQRLTEGVQDNDTVLSHLFKDALEADDEVMTVILCDPGVFEMYPIPYFHGCDLAVVQEISNLWLSQAIRRGFYYRTVLEPLVNQVKEEQLKGKNKPCEISATMMLCELLRRRSVKAGARLLEVMFSFRKDGAVNILVLVDGLVNRLMGFENGKFRKHFLGDLENLVREGQRHLESCDQVRSRHGQSITVGPSSAQTDSNLLCWAARRGYSKLIWCISLECTKTRPNFSSENLLEDATEESGTKLLWQVALWCATRHGHGSVVMELTRPPWVQEHIDFNNYAGIQGCLPPLHLVSLLGDRNLLQVLRMCGVGIESGAHKTDYLGKTPLDYAMQFQSTIRNFKEGMQFQVITSKIKNWMQFRASNNELNKWPQLCSTARCSAIRPQHNPYCKGAMPKPLVELQSCTQDLLQMSGVPERLKELNDMYTTQANFVLIGAALIASVAFSGWLQPPLGYTDYFQFTSPSPPAPAGTYEQYVAMEGHLSVQMFVAFNALSFFLGIGTMLIGAEATLFVHDNEERTIALTKVRKSIKWMLGFFITSMVCIMAAFICAGLAILPPIQRLEWSMIVSLCLGACICLIPLSWILLSLAKDQLVNMKNGMVKFILQCDNEKKSYDFVKDLVGSLTNEEDMKTLHDEMEEKKEKKWKEEKKEEKKQQKKEEKKEERPPNAYKSNISYINSNPI